MFLRIGMNKFMIVFVITFLFISFSMTTTYYLMLSIDTSGIQLKGALFQSFWLPMVMGSITVYTFLGMLDKLKISKDKLELIQVKLIQEKEKSEKASLAKSKFLSTMSHEIRTPLNAILSFNNRLFELETEHKKRKYLETIRMSSEQLLAIISDILDISKIESEVFELNIDSFDTKGELEKIYKIYSLLSKEKNITFTQSMSSSIPKFILCDRIRFIQIITNLLSNAIKFTPENGSIHFDIDYKSQNIYIEVIDSGIGVKEKNYNKIFDVFSQENADTNLIYGGTGLGLSIVKNLIQRMDGSIGVKQNITKGSIFYFNIYAPEKVEYSLKKKKKLLTYSEVRIMIAEDNETNRMVLEMLLEKYSLSSVCVVDGQELLDSISCVNPHIILMDINMPRLNGEEAMLAIRNNEKYQEYADIPIIAVTANAIQGDREYLLNLGMDDYIEKPIDPILLYKALAKYIDI